ncbi:hypothetical protein DV736_g3522, partial [Chaetothyriales sp. CBS 134916]
MPVPTPWLYWGYGVRHQVVKASGQFDHSKRLSRFKLLLDESKSTKRVRAPLKETCRRLCMTGLINTDTDLIAHYLEQLFRHTRDRLVNDTFVLIDAGGGTVDTITYTVDKETPLRLKTEEVELDSATCGSSFINERFEDLITKRLREEDYLRRDGEDFSRVIDRLVVEFEKIDKLTLDNMFPDHIEKYYLKVEGLRRNKQKRFRSDRMRLDRQSSYGFLRGERHQSFEEHAEERPVRDPADGLLYIDNTIEWMIHSGRKIPPQQEFSHDVEYTFALAKPKLEIRETLYVADRMSSDEAKRESHYRFDHPKNNGAELLSQIVFDVTHLRNTKYVKKKPPQIRKRLPYYKAYAKLVVIIDGRNLRYELRLRGGSNETVAIGQECLAAAFQPGTE